MPESAQQLARIRDRLEALSQWCPGKPAWRTVGPTRTNAELDAFEAEHQITIPASYRRFVSEIGDGGAGLGWHRDCSCGRLAPLDEWRLERSTRPFPINGDRWLDPETLSWLAARKHRLPKGTEPTDGTVQIANTTDHAALHLVLNGARAGEVWKDSTGYDGPFEKVADDFLSLSETLLHELVEEYRWRSPEENRAHAEELTPLNRVKFYCKSKNVNGLLASGDIEAEIRALCAAVDERKRATAISLIPLVLSSVVSRRVRIQDEGEGRAALDAAEIRLLVRLWKDYRGKLVGTEGYAHFGPYGWLGKFVLYPATMFGFAELWEDMLAEARVALGHDGIRCRANHVTHAHIALAVLGREPDDRLDYGGEKLNEWELWHLDKLVQRLRPEARERLRERVPPGVYSTIVD